MLTASITDHDCSKECLLKDFTVPLLLLADLKKSFTSFRTWEGQIKGPCSENNRDLNTHIYRYRHETQSVFRE